MSCATLYTPELAEAILQRVAGGESLNAIGSAPDMPSEGTIRGWGALDPTFAERLRQAREASAAHWDEQAERVLVNAASTREEIARARELSQVYRWRARVYSPREYADRVDLNVTGTLGIAAQLAEVRARRVLIDSAPEQASLPPPPEAGEAAP